ncbi:MAG TPA: sodium:solute symporter [Isosphaeraceae bacterium]|nr:sodium:solute symporter [Isosphaeraceae bacterium]
MNPIDLAVIAVYVAGCTALGAWLGSRSQGLKGYFLGESNIPAWAVMISIVATETSTATFLSVPGVAYRGDFTYLQLPMGYLLGRVIVATVLLPAYFRGQIFTAYQVLRDRFGGPTRTTASLLFLVARSLGDGLRLFLAATMLRHLTGWSLETAIVAVAAITVVYTFLGGMKAVIWTDVIQFSVYILGALVALMILAGRLPGGWSELVQTARAAGKFRLLDFSFDLTRPFTFWAGLIGGMVLNTATHGADQMMVQRYLAARSQRQAAVALVSSGFIILAQFAFFLLIGVSLWVFYQVFPPTEGLGSAGAGLARSDEVFSYFIVHYLPTGVLGLVVAAVFSAAMGTLAGSLNSSAATIVNDLYRPVTGVSDERHLMRLSRAMTVLWGVVLTAVAFGARGLEDNVVNNALAIASFVSGILLGLFLLGILTRRVGQSAALAGALAGIAAVTAAKFATPLAWPWFALVGSSTVFAVGLAASFVVPSWSEAPEIQPVPSE